MSQVLTDNEVASLEKIAELRGALGDVIRERNRLLSALRDIHDIAPYDTPAYSISGQAIAGALQEASTT